MRFWNRDHKRKFILEAIGHDEKVSLSELMDRLASRGYRPSKHELALFIRNNMLYRYLAVEKKNGINLYRRI
jgi:predicted DNA-binding ribbon-helix-helix protein